MITVAKDGSGDYTTIQEAVSALGTDGGTVYIHSGIYEERVELHTSHVTLIGEEVSSTVLRASFYANMQMEDGSKRGTFRSYTFLVLADDFHAYNMTFENASGFGTEVGQAIAVYAEGDHISFKNCRILGHQDTLFTGPLPMKEIKKGGFTGPTEFAERIPGHQLYEDCYICGEVDFIFGSAIAYFHNCELYALNRNKEINAFYTAPSTYEGQPYGYVFEGCHLHGNCPAGTVYLSRPWRSHAKAVFLHCDLSDQIAPAGFHDWNKPESHEQAYYAEYQCTGKGASRAGRPSYVHQLTDQEASLYTKALVYGK